MPQPESLQRVSEQQVEALVQLVQESALVPVLLQPEPEPESLAAELRRGRQTIPKPESHRRQRSYRQR